MAAITGINLSASIIGAREDLADTITMISPEETPLYTNSVKSVATGLNH